MLRDLPFTEGEVQHFAFMNGTPGDDYDDHFVYSSTTIDPLDDVFGSTQSSPRASFADGEQQSAANTTQSFLVGPSDVPRLRSRHVTEGYREGIAESKDKHIQAGFDEGYSLGAEVGLLAGWCLGICEGICRALTTQVTQTPVQSEAGCTARSIHRDVRALLVAAREQLTMQGLFSSEYFGEDGVWKYEVPGQEAELNDITFRDVAAAHPLLKAWITKIQDRVRAVNLALL